MSKFEVLAKFEELYLYFTNAMYSRKIPAAIKYSAGEEILKGLSRIGGNIHLANQIKENPKRIYEAKKLALDAKDDFLRTEYMIRMLVLDDRVGINKSELFRRETEFKKILDGWIQALSSPGRR